MSDGRIERLGDDLQYARGMGRPHHYRMADLDSLERELADLRLRLRLIGDNAESFHKGEDGKERALAVIAGWARGGEIAPPLLASRSPDGGEQ